MDAFKFSIKLETDNMQLLKQVKTAL